MPEAHIVEGIELKFNALAGDLESNRKTREGADHPDRNAQFEHIARRVAACRRLPGSDVVCCFWEWNS